MRKNTEGVWVLEKNFNKKIMDLGLFYFQQVHLVHKYTLFVPNVNNKGKNKINFLKVTLFVI